jgi:hypothetical protein
MFDSDTGVHLIIQFLRSAEIGFSKYGLGPHSIGS